MQSTNAGKSDPNRISQENINVNKSIYTKHFDVDYLGKITEKISVLIDKGYFRSKITNLENIEIRNEEDNPTIFYSNHSGMAFPWDGMLFCAKLYHNTNENLDRFTRPIIAKELGKNRFLSPFLVKNIWKKVGAVEATYLNFETMLQYPKGNLLIYPEGVPGISKGFDKKYKVQRFASSMVRLACKYKTEIAPIYTINAEYINPYCLSFNGLNKITGKFGLPFLPIGLQLPLLIICPWIFYYSLPCRINYVVGKQFKPWELIQKNIEDINESDVIRMTKLIQSNFQKDLLKKVEIYGKKPFEWNHFFKMLFKDLSIFPLNTPFGWPLFFTEFERRYQNNIDMDDFEFNWKAFFKYMWLNPFCIWFYIPVIGWLFIYLKSRK